MVVIATLLIFLSMYLGGKCWKIIFSPVIKKEYFLKDFFKCIMFFALYVITLLIIISIISVIPAL